eukprot:9475138-Pyramimonas_sp.AAC.1
MGYCVDAKGYCVDAKGYCVDVKQGRHLFGGHEVHERVHRRGEHVQVEAVGRETLGGGKVHEVVPAEWGAAARLPLVVPLVPLAQLHRRRRAFAAATQAEGSLPAAQGVRGRSEGGLEGV